MKRLFKFILGLFLTVVLIAVGFVSYLLVSYSRIGNVDLDITNKSNLEEIDSDQTYKVATYNIGFGAYSQDFTFFLDTGYDKDGNETCGHDSKAKSKDEVIKNTNGSIKTMKDLNLDFMLLQEVDIKSTRSHKVNQNEMFSKEFSEYDNVFCINFDSAFLPYPLYDMHGKSLAGLSTYSKYKIKEAYRKQYTISDSLSKFFDLDRCFSVSILNVNNGKKLYLINSHMSAYDKGGTIRQKQIFELNEYLNSIKENNDYVVLGGDFNHDLLTYNPNFSYTKENRAFNMTLKDPDWVASYFDENCNSPLIDGYNVIASDNVPTCRNNDIPWDPNVTYRCVVDGFIFSNNIEIITHYNIETKDANLTYNGFAYSDHQPAYVEFKLL